MQLEDLKIIQTTTTVNNTNDKLVISKGDAKTPKTIAVGVLLQKAVGNLPTSNPASAGALWLNSGVLTVSEG